MYRAYSVLFALIKGVNGGVTIELNKGAKGGVIIAFLKRCLRLLFNKPFDVRSRFADGLADKLGLGPEESFLVLQLLGEAGSISDRTKLLSASAQVAVNLGSAKIRNKQTRDEK